MDINLVNLPDYKSVDTGNGRFYNIDGKQYPSITTVLDAVTDKSFLIKWRERVGNAEAYRISNRSRARGTALHKICERYILGEDYRAGQMPINMEAFQKIRPYLDANLTEVNGLEIALYSDFLGVGGRSDLVGKWCKKRAIIDYKTSRWIKKESDIVNYFVQIAAYSIMFEERTGLPVPRLVIIMAVDDEPKPLIFVKSRDDYTAELLDMIDEYRKMNND